MDWLPSSIFEDDQNAFGHPDPLELEDMSELDDHRDLDELGDFGTENRDCGRQGYSECEYPWRDDKRAFNRPLGTD